MSFPPVSLSINNAEKKINLFESNYDLPDTESTPLLEIVVESNDPPTDILNTPTPQKITNYIIKKDDVRLFQNFLDLEMEKYAKIDAIGQSLKMHAKRMTMASVANRITFIITFSSFLIITSINLAHVDTKTSLVTYITTFFGCVSFIAAIVKCYSRRAFNKKKEEIGHELNRLIKIHSVLSGRSCFLRCIGWDGTGCEPPIIVDLDGSISRSGIYVPYQRELDYLCCMPIEGPKSIYDFTRFKSHYVKVLKACKLLNRFETVDFDKVTLFTQKYKIPINFTDYTRFLSPVWQYDNLTPTEIEEAKKMKLENPQTSICDVANRYLRFQEIVSSATMPSTLLEIIFRYQDQEKIPESTIV